MRFYLFLLLGLVFYPCSVSWATSYDFYVDSGAEKGGDGSREKPFSSIGKALSSGCGDSLSKCSIYVSKGEYKENLSLRKNIKLYGKDRKDVSIYGSVEMGDDTLLKDVSLVSKEVSTAVRVLDKADVEIYGCSIKNFKKIGINAVPGSGEVVAKNNIISGGAKGFYIEYGRDVDISGNTVSGNSEEGIDLRAKIRGVIENNLIEKNGESGIELIVGKADLKITNNIIRGNSASGIAVQFYSDTKGEGKIDISKNKISKNRSYGLVCKTPSGGSYSGSYWNNSISLSGNSFSENRIKSIAKHCKIIEALDEEKEKEDNSIDDTLSSGGQDESEEAERREAEEEERIRLEEEIMERETFLKSQLESLSEENFINEQKVFAIRREMEKRGKLKLFFFGNKLENISKLNLLLEEKKTIAEKMTSLESVSVREDNRQLFFQSKVSLAGSVGSLERYISLESSRRGFFGEAVYFFKSRLSGIRLFL